MKAMIFAAGLGTRLKPFTDHAPKALVEVGGETMLGRVIRRLSESGIKDMVVNTHHFSQQICDYLYSKNNFGVNIRVSDESNDLLDTGGGLLAARELLDGSDDILLHNADIFTDVSYRPMMEYHAESGADATLMVWDRQSSRALLFDGNDRMQGWHNTVTGQLLPEGVECHMPQLHPLAFGGIHIVSPRIFPLLELYRHKHGRVFSLTPFYVEYCHEFDIRAYSPHGNFYWEDVGKPQSLARARQYAVVK